MICTNTANQILQALFGVSSSYSASSNLYLGLSSAQPKADGTGFVEPTAPSYARKQIASTKSSGTSTTKESMFGNADGGVITNKTEILMNTARESWGVLKYWFITSSSSKGDGTAILWGDLTGEIAETGVAAETVPVFYENELKASIDVSLADWTPSGSES